MKDLWNYLKETKKPIVLYGMGNGADLVIEACYKYGIKISGVFASDGFVRTKIFHGMPVTDYKTAKDTFSDMIVLVCFGTSLPEVINNVKKIAAQNELYFPDGPVCGGGLFTADYYETRKDEFDRVYSLLADDTSKKVFENIVEYKLSGDIDYLFASETGEEEPYENFLKLGKNETYLDLGAYRGDTVLSFVNRAGEYKKIIAVEPDEKSFKKLLDVAENLKNVDCINAFAGEDKSKIDFNMNTSRGFGRSGKIKNIEKISVDSLNISPTFIKIDIEGGEAAAIEGAKETIKKYKPKMQIAAYHKIGDLADIPKAVLRINSSYKIYLRHNPCLPAWDVNFFFI